MAQPGGLDLFFVIFFCVQDKKSKEDITKPVKMTPLEYPGTSRQQKKNTNKTKLYGNNSQSRSFREAVFVAALSEWLSRAGPSEWHQPGGLDLFFVIFFCVPRQKK
jgi:hypothetical protein